MKTKEVKIEIPEGYEIDKENSTFECIKFKPVVKRWRDDEYAELNGFYVHSGYSEVKEIKKSRNVHNCKCIFATEKQAKSALAMAQISQIMVNDKRFGGIITGEEWRNGNKIKICIKRSVNQIICKEAWEVFHFLAFHTKDQCDLFLKENKDLVKDYLMID